MPRIPVLLLAVLFAAILWPGCTFVTDPPKEVEGWKPIYGQTAALQNIYAGPPEPMGTAGKIYLRSPYIFINDVAKGIHVVDNSNPTNPVKVAFIHIPMNVDLAIKNQVLYADNGPDLVAIDITNLQSVQVLKRIPGLFPSAQYPPQTGWFECYDPTQGAIIGWEKTTLYEPECRR